jgi:hypothetical protein
MANRGHEKHIHCTTTAGKEKQAIELLEQDGRRLMDCAQNRLPIACEFLQ